MSADTSRSFRNRNALSPGTVLRDYVLVSARAEGRGETDELGSGGFGIVYLTRHRDRDHWLFAIKEFFPPELAVRDPGDGASVWASTAEAEAALADGLSRFRREAEQLRRFRNERHVVSCVNYFEENGTAYMVMDYDDGVPLSKYLRLREEKGRPFTEADLLAVAVPMLEGLEAVHRAEVLHRDIKPGNVFVRREDDRSGRPAEPVLMDFGAAKQQYLSRHSRSNAPYTPGYAAPEQQAATGRMSPATDLYAVGALLWRMVAGGTPGHPGLMVADDREEAEAGSTVWSPEPRYALARMGDLYSGRADPMPTAVELGAGRFSGHVLRAIDRCLAIDVQARPQDCGELLGLLRGNVDEAAPTHGTAGAGGKANKTDTPARRVAAAGDASGPPRAARRRWPLLAGGLALTLVVALSGVWLSETGWEYVAERLGLQPDPYGTLSLELEPPDAEVELEDHDGAYLPGMRLPEGEYRVLVSRAGYRTTARRVAVSGDTMERVELALNRQPFTVRATPVEARVELVRHTEAYAPGMLLEPGEYRVRVSAAGYERWEGVVRHGGEPTQEAVNLARLDDHGDTRSEATRVSLGSSAAGELTAGDTDYFSVTLSGPGILVAHTTGDTDTVGAVEDTAGRALGEDDDGGGDTNFRVSVPVDSGTYYIRVRGYYSTDSGSYALHASRSWPAGATFTDALSSGGEGPEMVVIPAGRFRMGCVNDDGDCDDDEKPVHEVRIAEEFALGRYEVTFEDWDRCVSGGGCAGYRPDDQGWGRDNRPVVDVSWEDAQSYVGWLSGETGQRYRLLSEAEWEYVARAGSSSAYSWGNAIGTNRANCDGCGSRWDNAQTAPVGSFQVNAFGVYDMHGNVWEWVEDCWNDGYSRAPTDGSAWRSGDCDRRVLRGRSWGSLPRNLRSASRFRLTTGIRYNDLGFRVARTLTP